MNSIESGVNPAENEANKFAFIENLKKANQGLSAIESGDPSTKEGHRKFYQNLMEQI